MGGNRGGRKWCLSSLWTPTPSLEDLRTSTAGAVTTPTAVRFSHLQARSRLFLSCSEKWPLQGSSGG